MPVVCHIDDDVLRWIDLGGYSDVLCLCLDCILDEVDEDLGDLAFICIKDDIFRQFFVCAYCTADDRLLSGQADAPFCEFSEVEGFLYRRSYASKVPI